MPCSAVAVGVLAARQGGRAMLALPAALLVAMVAGGATCFAGTAMPMIETGIAGSVLVLGVAILFAERVSPSLAAVLVASFGVLNGHAHGAEIAPALLHAAGLAIARAGEFRVPAIGLARASGVVFALAGAALLAA